MSPEALAGGQSPGLREGGGNDTSPKVMGNSSLLTQDLVHSHLLWLPGSLGTLNLL